MNFRQFSADNSTSSRVSQLKEGRFQSHQTTNSGKYFHLLRKVLHMKSIYENKKYFGRKYQRALVEQGYNFQVPTRKALIKEFKDDPTVRRLLDDLYIEALQLTKITGENYFKTINEQALGFVVMTSRGWL